MQNCSTVRKRALTYLAKLREMGIDNTIPLENAKRLFSQILDLWNHLTIKAYFGTQLTFKRQRIQQRSRYQTGTVSIKTIELTHEVKHTEGYMERMGLVSIMRGQDGYYMKIHNAVLVPQPVRIEHKSIENLYISPIAAGKEREATSHEVVSLNGKALDTRQNTHNLLGDIYKTCSVETEERTLFQVSLTPPEKAILRPSQEEAP